VRRCLTLWIVPRTNHPAIARGGELFDTTIPRKVVAAFIVRGTAVQYTIGQVEIFAFDFAPTGFAACQGQLLPISQNQALFSLLGTRYGGNGVTDFGLPKLAPVAPQGPFYFICIQGGSEPRRAEQA